MPSNAATVGNDETIIFAPIAVGRECTFTPGANGALGKNGDNTLIGTEEISNVAGGARPGFSVLANFPAQLVLDSLNVSKDSSLYTPDSTTLYLSRPGANVDSALGTVALEIDESVSTEITAGVIFAPASGSNSFAGGDYGAQLTLTCTTDGNK